MTEMQPQIPHPTDAVPPTISGDVETLRYHRSATQQIIAKPRSHIESAEAAVESRSHKLEVFHDLGQLERDVIAAIKASLDGAEHMDGDEITKLASPGSVYIRKLAIGNRYGKDPFGERPYDALQTELGRILGRQVIDMLVAKEITWPNTNRKNNERIDDTIRFDVNGLVLTQALRSIQAQRDAALPDDGPTLALTLRRVEEDLNFSLTGFDDQLNMEELCVGVSKPILSGRSD